MIFFFLSVFLFFSLLFLFFTFRLLDEQYSAGSESFDIYSHLLLFLFIHLNLFFVSVFSSSCITHIPVCVDQLAMFSYLCERSFFFHDDYVFFSIIKLELIGITQYYLLNKWEVNRCIYLIVTS